MADEPLEPPLVDAAASFGQRALARAIDLVIVSSVIVLLGGFSATTDGEDTTIPVWVVLVLAGTFLAYETTMVAMYGRTIGKFATRIEIVSASDGSRPAVVQALLRALVAVAGLVIAPGLGVALMAAVYLTALVDREQGRGLPDRLAGTVVVERLQTEPAAGEFGFS